MCLKCNNVILSVLPHFGDWLQDRYTLWDWDSCANGTKHSYPLRNIRYIFLCLIYLCYHFLKSNMTFGCSLLLRSVPSPDPALWSTWHRINHQHYVQTWVYNLLHLYMLCLLVCLHDTVTFVLEKQRNIALYVHILIIAQFICT